jgi:TusE/DsrC/DsvC family sulfur relay protein
MVLIVQDKEVETDEDGCLLHFEDWDEDVARVIAQREGVQELMPDMISMLKFIRFYYKTHDFFPIINAICKSVNEPKGCVEEKFINPLLSWKIAGLPHPEEPMISLLKAGQSPG